MNSNRFDKKQFVEFIWNFYEEHKRDFPWRNTTDPYQIVVSEVMLQQTQTYRVEPKFLAFIKTFPTFEALANAEFADVLALWSGLGYNRRAFYLREIAKAISEQYDGNLPPTPEQLDDLPGLGRATACSILVFAKNIPLTFIETNIRRVYLEFFFPGEENVSDNLIMPLIEETVDRNNPREWYYALMDYGAFLGVTSSNANKRSKHYTKQSKFEGSIRKVRGEVLRKLLALQKVQREELYDLIEDKPERIDQAVDGLLKDGLIKTEHLFLTLS